MRSLVEKYRIRFDEVRYSNDCIFSVKVGINASKIMVRNESYYVVTESENSLTSDYLSKPGELECRADVFFRVLEIVGENSYPIDVEQAYMFLRRLLVKNKQLFVKYSSFLLDITGMSKRQLMSDLFRENSFKSRIKRSVYTYFALTFSHRS